MIKSVKITNWKGHHDFEKSFEKGINFIVGPNGAGKTSVLDAVCFALLGNLEATPIYRNITYKDLIRDPSKDMEIILEFSAEEDKTYIIKRGHSSNSKRISCELSTMNEVITRKWDDATVNILELYQTNDLFMRRIILLSEGDTYEFSVKPPGEGLTSHIENVLGIDRLEGLSSSLGELRSKLINESRDYKTRIELIEDITTDDLEKMEETSNKIETLEADRHTLAVSLNELIEISGKFDPQRKSLEHKIAQLNSIIADWTGTLGNIPKDYGFSGAIEPLTETLSGNIDRIRQNREALKEGIAWISAQIKSHEQILELIPPLEEQVEDVLCPVCSRPLTADMLVDIKHRTELLIDELRKRESEKQSELPKLSKDLDTNEISLRVLNSVAIRLDSLLQSDPKSTSPHDLQKILTSISENEAENQSMIDQIEAEISSKNEEIKLLNQEHGKLQSKMSGNEREEVQNSLYSSTKGRLITELFMDSVDSALADQRRVLLEPLTTELSNTWSKFLGNEVVVRIKDNAQLVVVNAEKNTEFEFPQLSGGEKTALLIITQVSLSQSFSDANFMLLDEPLEHLDARNRWSLVRFLIDAARQGNPQQLIVTTVEESLIREYIDEPDIDIEVFSR